MRSDSDSDSEPCRSPSVGDDITVTINGCPADLPMGSTVADVITHAGVSARGTAVARNDEVVPRSTWATVPLVHGDRVELLVAAQGG